jgi:hypothetical protein
MLAGSVSLIEASETPNVLLALLLRYDFYIVFSEESDRHQSDELPGIFQGVPLTLPS